MRTLGMAQILSASTQSKITLFENVNTAYRLYKSQGNEGPPLFCTLPSQNGEQDVQQKSELIHMLLQFLERLERTEWMQGAFQDEAEFLVSLITAYRTYKTHGKKRYDKTV